MMGCSNNHPHGQAWSLSEIPSIPAKELESLQAFALNPENHNSKAPRGSQGKLQCVIFSFYCILPALGRPCLLCEYAHTEYEMRNGKNNRIVVFNQHWLALVPWWAVWPFEILGEPLKT